MSKKIIVTGGAGYIGSHTCLELIAAGYDPVIIDNFSNSEPYIVDRIKELSSGDVVLHQGDCTDISFLREVVMKTPGISGVIHFAAYKAVGESSQFPLKYYYNNLLSTINLLKVMEEAGIPTLVFSSSCTVYGQPDKLPVTEDTPIKPAESTYGRTKQMCEDIIKDYFTSGARVKAISLRYFNPIGAHPSAKLGELPTGVPNNLVPYITQVAAGIREKLTIFGDDYDTVDGTCVRDYIHVVDLAKAHVSAIRHLNSIRDQSYYDTFNLGTGRGNSVQEVVDTFEEVNDLKLNYEVGPRREGDVEKTYADVSKSKNILNWQAEIGLAQSLRDSWNWQKTLKK
jgi:UDP-glucose 4-epimerase